MHSDTVVKFSQARDLFPFLGIVLHVRNVPDSLPAPPVDRHMIRMQIFFEGLHNHERAGCIRRAVTCSYSHSQISHCQHDRKAYQHRVGNAVGEMVCRALLELDLVMQQNNTLPPEERDPYFQNLFGVSSISGESNYLCQCL